MASVARAFALGGSGVEIDIYFMPAEGVFIVSHGHPDKNGNNLTLKAMFESVGVSGEGYFWLDYKNLGDLTAAQTVQAIKRLSAISSEGGLRERLYIEGVNPLMLTDYRQAGFRTILDAQLPPDNWPVTHFVTSIYKAAYYFGDHTVLGMPYGTLDEPVYGPETRELLGTLPVFLYHVPDNRALLQGLVSNKAVRALLVGRDVSVARFDINICSDE
ncbi:MAG: hypothetical protein OQL05_00665 [Gammaproteobacteria bacterium]|nr:hypothetical protein [Gammaproteobacteria bacterium]